MTLFKKIKHYVELFHLLLVSFIVWLSDIQPTNFIWKFPLLASVWMVSSLVLITLAIFVAWGIPSIFFNLLTNGEIN